MPRFHDQERKSQRYQEVNSAETQATVRRNLFLMLAAAVGIAISFGVSRMCSVENSGSEMNKQAEALVRNLDASIGDYTYDVQIIETEGQRIRCTVYVIAAQGVQNPELHVDEFERIASEVFGKTDGEIVWRFYRKSATTAGGDPAFIGMHRSEIADLPRSPGPDDENN